MRAATVSFVIAAGAACGRVSFDGALDGGESSDSRAVDCKALPASDPRYCGPLLLATGQYQPFGLAITPTHVIWLCAGDGALRACAKTGCGATPTLLALGKPFGYFVAVDETHVYWNHNQAGELLRCPLEGCPGGNPELLASVATATFVVVDDTYLYTSTNDGRLVRVLKTGGAPIDLATGLADPAGIALSGGMMLWAIRGEDRIVRVPLGGGSPMQLVGGQGRAQVVATNGTSMVWATSSAIMKSDLDGQGVTMVAAAAGPHGLVLDDKHVYWTNGDGGSTVVKAPLDGGPATVIASAVVEPQVIAVDANYAFFTGYGDGDIHRVPLGN